MYLLTYIFIVLLRFYIYKASCIKTLHSYQDNKTKLYKSIVMSLHFISFNPWFLKHPWS